MCEDRAKNLSVGFEDWSDRDGEEFDAEVLRERARIGLATFGGVWPGHRNAEDVRRPESRDCDGGNDGRVDAATEPDDGLGETAFADVIARSGDKRRIGVSDFVVGLLVHVADPGDGIKEDEVFFEGFGLCGDSALGRESHAGTVEYQGVVSADLIYIHNGTFVMARDGSQHADAQVALVDGAGGGGDVEKNAGTLGGEFKNGIASVHGRRPEVLVVPGVLANGDTELLVVEGINVLAISRLEIAGLVEDVVGRKEHFGLLENNAAF